MPSDAAGMKAKRDERKAAGLCPGCGKGPPEKGWSLCEICHDKQEIRRLRFVAMKEDLGLCDCGSKVEKGKKRCRTCLDIINIQNKDVYWTRKAAGECVQCGRPTRKSRRLGRKTVHCDRCRLLAHRYYLGKKKRIARRELKLKRQLDLAASLKMWWIDGPRARGGKASKPKAAG
jgi:hypothetical protein